MPSSIQFYGELPLLNFLKNFLPYADFSELLGCIACAAQMRPIATRVARSVVCVSVLDTRVNCAKTAEPIAWASLVTLGSKELCVKNGGAHWHHLANTVELSVCGGGVSVSKITLTTCFGIIQQILNTKLSKLFEYWFYVGLIPASLHVQRSSAEFRKQPKIQCFALAVNVRRLFDFRLLCFYGL